MPQNPYQAHPYARLSSLGQQVHASHRSEPTRDIRQREDDEEASLGGMIVSPWNTDCRRQALEQRISPFDLLRLGNVRYHGGNNGYNPLTEGIIHRCGYTEINSTDVLLSYTDIIDVHA